MKERKKIQFVCDNCRVNFESKCTTARFCSTECRKEFHVKDGRELGRDYVICQVCNRATANATGMHLKNHPDWTPERYHKEFPEAQIIADNALEKITAGSRSGGSRMREPEHRARMSQNLSGENNPMHRSRTTEEKRKSLSPFSPTFYLSKNPGLSTEEAESLAKVAQQKIKDMDILLWTNYEYWMKKGHSEEEAKKIVSEKQSTFSLEKCIQKYGEEEGRKRWLERQEKWTKNFKKNNYSKNSQELFALLFPVVSKKYKEIYFATLDENKEIVKGSKNHEFRLRLNGKVIMPDFFVKESRKIIEFDGIYWHDHKRRNKPENYKRELERDREIKESGYEILRITELEWENDPAGTVKKCLDFLLDS